MAVVRLQEDLICILNGEKQWFDPVHGASLLGKCSTGEGKELVLESCHPDDVTTHTTSLDFIHPDRLPQIKSIADTMFASGREQEFCQAFIGFSRYAFTVYLRILGMEDLESDIVHKMEWEYLSSLVNKWGYAIKNFIGCHLSGAKDAFNQIMGEHRHIISTSFIESSQASLTFLLNFGHAIVSGLHKEQGSLFLLICMCEDLTSIIPAIDALFPDEPGPLIHVAFYDLLTRLRDSAKVVLKELVNFFGSCYMEAIPYASIHPITRSVVNCILRLGEYESMVISLLEEETTEKMDQASIVDDGRNVPHPLTAYVQSLMSVLEERLYDVSNAYTDMSWKHIFLMNNIHYMIQRIENSKLCPYFGDEWIKTHTGRFRQHAMCYQRVTWSCVLSCIHYNLDPMVFKANCKAKCQAFTIAFEEVYRSQTKLYVPNIQLREELRLSAFQIVIHAYQSFLCRAKYAVDNMHIIYTVKDLENYFQDLLQGSSKTLNHSKRRRWRLIRRYP